LNVCVDSSFLVSSYVSDSNSQESDRRRLARPAIWVTPLNRSEFAHAVYAQVFRGFMNLDQANQLAGLMEQDCANGIWIPVGFPENVWQTSIDLARRFCPTLGVRTLHTLHIACALELHADRFWTFDDRQIQLAHAVGLNTSA